jgi:hypothetical protein
MKDQLTNSINQNMKDHRRYSMVLLLAALPALVATAHAQTYGFNLIKAPTAAADDGIGGVEVMRLTGGGLVSADGASGGGSFSVAHALELGGATGRGTWVITGLVSFEPLGGPNPGLQGGTLVVNVSWNFSFGVSVPGQVTIYCPATGGVLDESGDGIAATLGEEEFDTEPAPGSTAFHIVSK